MKKNFNPKMTKSSPSATHMSSASAATTSMLYLGYLPETSGSGRIAATKKAGLEESGIGVGGVGNFQTPVTLPTVAVVKWAPVLGSLNLPNDRSNVSAAVFAFYNSIRARNASVSAYSPNDIIKAFEALTSLAMIFGDIRRKLNVLCSAGSAINAAYPEGFMRAVGLTVADRTALNSYITRYNQLTELCKQFTVPKAYKLFSRRATLASAVYRDDRDIDKTQFIIMEPSHYWYWDLDPSSATVGQLVMAAMPSGILAEFTVLENLINSYSLDNDMNNIFAEIRKAYDLSDCYTLQPFPIDGARLDPIFDQLLLDQLHNGTLCGAISTLPSILENAVTGQLQYSTNSIRVTPGAKFDQSGPLFRVYDETSLNMRVAVEYPNTIRHVYAHDNQPDEDNMASLLAFKAMLYRTNISGTWINVVQDCGSEILMTVDIYVPESSRTPLGITVAHLIFSDVTIIEDGSASYNLLNDASNVGWWSFAERIYADFGYLPVRYVNFEDQNSVEATTLVEGDVDNRFEVSISAMATNHRAVLAWLIVL